MLNKNNVTQRHYYDTIFYGGDSFYVIIYQWKNEL